MAKPRIVWKQRSIPADDNFILHDIAGVDDGLDSNEQEALSAPDFNKYKRLMDSIERFGIPEVQGAASPKEDAIGLLMLAAEIEHALMVQYLYAAQSVRGVAGRMVSHIAVQEMGHLLTVQNLLLILEGISEEEMPTRIHLGRDQIRGESTYDPIPYVLEPISRSALAKFIVAERPDIIDDESLRNRVEALEDELSESGIDPKPIYALYSAIRWIFQSGNEDPAGLPAELGFKEGWHLKDEDFVSSESVAPFCSKPSEWGSLPGLIIMPVYGRGGALSAIDAVTEQGEGAPGSHESHFHDFVEVLNKFEAGEINVKPLPQSPYTRFQPEPSDTNRSKIKNPYTVLWCRLFDVVYELLLLDIAWGLSLQHSNMARAKMLDVALDTMSQTIQPLASLVADKPLNEVGGPLAGPTYGLENEDIPDTLSGFSERYSKILGERSDLITTIQSDDEFGSDIQGFLVIDSISKIDLQRSPNLP